MKARYLGALWLVCALAYADDTAWLEGVTSLKQGDYARAETSLGRWVVEQMNEGVHSPEAHYNLGLALWHQKKSGQAMFHWATATTLQPNPIAAWRYLGVLSSVEKELGVGEALSESTLFRLWVIITDNWALMLAALGAWTLCGCALLAWTQGRRANHAVRLLSVVPIGCLTLALAVFLFRRVANEYGVIDGDKTVPVFRLADDKPENKLVELPAGALVESAGPEKDFIRITEPVSGWIAASSYHPLRQR